MEVEIQVWTLIGVVIAGGGIATALILHAMASLGGRVGVLDRQVDAIGARVDAIGTRVDAIGARVDALDNKIDVKFDFLSSRIDGLVTEVGHMNLTLGELVGKAHTHGRVA
jgi:hypothetical protein